MVLRKGKHVGAAALVADRTCSSVDAGAILQAVGCGSTSRGIPGHASRKEGRRPRLDQLLILPQSLDDRVTLGIRTCA